MPEIEGRKPRRPGFKKGERKRIEKSQIIEMFKNTFIMLAIAVVAGGVLGFVYEQTKAPIAEMEQRTKQNACRKVFYNAASFSETVINEYPVTDEFRELWNKVDITNCMKAEDGDGNLLGYVVEVVTHEGYGGDIDFYVGISLDGTVNGISFIEISETAGLGMRADEVLSPQFKNRLSDRFVVTKNGAASDEEIDAISSATITSKAVVGGVNAALDYFRMILGGGGDES